MENNKEMCGAGGGMGREKEEGGKGKREKTTKL